MTYAEKLMACRNARIRCAGAYARIEWLENSIDLAERGIGKPQITQGLISKINFYKNALEAEWDRLGIFQTEFKQTTEAAYELIKPLPPAWQKLLCLRYMEARDWEWISRYLPYSKDKCRKMHDEALSALKVKEDDACTKQNTKSIR